MQSDSQANLLKAVPETCLRLGVVLPPVHPARQCLTHLGPGWVAQEKSPGQTDWDCLLTAADQAPELYSPAARLILLSREDLLSPDVPQGPATLYLQTEHLDPAFLALSLRQALERQRGWAELSQAESRLRGSRQDLVDLLETQADRLQELLDMEPVGYFSLDTRGLILDINRTGAAFLGQPRGLLQGRPLKASLSPSCRRPFQTYLHKCVSSGEPGNLELTLKDGRLVRLWSRPHHGRLQAAMADVTETLQAQAALRATVENLPDAVLTLDVAGVIQSANPAAEMIFQQPASKLVGNPLTALFPRAEPLLVPGCRQETGRRWDQRLFPAQLCLTQASPGRPGPLIAIVRDLTEPVRVKRELASIAERERRRIGQDLHDDLGQQLTGIAYVAESLRSRLDGPAEEARLGSRLVVLSKQAIGKIRALARGLCPLTLEEEGCWAAFRELAEGSSSLFGVECQFQATGGPEPTGNLSTHLYRLAQEALNNAVRHARPRLVCIRLTVRADQLTLEVEDDGCGFNPRSGNSRGLGLRSMRQHSLLMGGTLELEQPASGGTIVRCRVPQGGQDMADDRAR